MSIEAPVRLITADEFCATIPDGVKADLLDGVIEMASPDTPQSENVGVFTRNLFNFFSRRRGGLGEAYGSRVAFVLERHSAPEPDVSFVCAERSHVITRTRGVGAPDIAVEVVSTDSRDRDYVRKKRQYERAGVREYWILDPDDGRCTFYRLTSAGYEEAPLENGRIYRSVVLPGFWVDVNWLLAYPLPDELGCLEKILEGDPL